MISVDKLSLQFSGQKIFEDISFQIGPKDRIGLTGKNGAGKSTLLKILIGEQQADEGQIAKPEDISIGYLPQQLNCTDQLSVYDETLTAFAEVNKLQKEIDHLSEQLSIRTDYESDEYMEMVEILSEKNDRLVYMNASNKDAVAEQTLKGLGFKKSDFSRPTGEFSGGWRMRIELAKILLRSPDIFLLDEPTNHLDIESIQWLETFLSTYRGSVVLISHDRAFLDKITNRTVEISLAKIYDYKASYTKYLELRAERKEQQMAAYINQQKLIDDTKEFIERFRYKATKAVQVQSRIKQLEKLDIIEVDEDDTAKINIKFPPAPRAGTIIFKATELNKYYGSNHILNDINIAIERGEKVAFVGKNGEGKTTLSRIIVNDVEADGEYSLGHNVNLGYFAQNQDELLDVNKTVFETLDDVAVGDVRTKVRDILGAFLFSGENIDKKVKVLSGGEKSRLSMAKLLLEPYNVLVLDEPTNHLDMRSKDILKNALSNYDGTLILVSHDREFLNGLTDKIYEFRDKKIKEHRCNIYEFLEKKNLEHLDDLNKGAKNTVNSEKKKNSVEKKLAYEERKELDRMIGKVQRKTSGIESKIETLENRQAEIESLLVDNKPENNDIYIEYDQNKANLAKLMGDWEKLNIELDELMQRRN